MRATMSAPMLGCSRSMTHSSSSSGPGLESTAPATAIVPTSCSRPARRRSPCRLSGSPSSRPTSSASSATPTSCSFGTPSRSAAARASVAATRTASPVVVAAAGRGSGGRRGRAPGPLRLAAASATSARVQERVDVVPGCARAPRCGDRDAQLAAGRAQRLAGQRGRDLVADAPQRLGVAQVGHEHGEAPAADVRDRVVRADAVREPARELAQHGVADGMAALLVELAQAVDVEQDERGATCARAASARARVARRPAGGGG